MKDTKVLRAQRNAVLLQRQFLHSDGSLFDQVCDAQLLTTVLAAHGTSCRERLYPPLDTLRLFIWQVLSADRIYLMSRIASDMIAFLDNVYTEYKRRHFEWRGTALFLCSPSTGKFISSTQRSTLPTLLR
jgi:hypothetical protein